MQNLLKRNTNFLQVAADKSGNKYLLCDYNRDGDSYRSPWTNIYSPPLEIGPDGEGGVLPSDKLRILEVREHTDGKRTLTPPRMKPKLIKIFYSDFTN